MVFAGPSNNLTERGIHKTRLEWVKQVSSAIGIPLTVGGGIATIEDIGLVLEAGADKVSMNSAAVKNPSLVREASQLFGSDKITAAKEDDPNLKQSK